MNNLKSLTDVFLSVKDQGTWIEVESCPYRPVYARLVRFDRRMKDYFPLSHPVAQTLVVSFAPAHLSFSIQVGSLLRQVKILDTGHHVIRRSTLAQTEQSRLYP